MCEVGDAVGIIAAQSIGEPGNAADDAHVPHGRRRGRRHHARPPARGRDLRGAEPKGAAKLSSLGRRSKIEDTDRGPKLSIIVEDEEEPVSYQLPRRTRVLVADGQVVQPGDALHEGSLNPADLLA